MAAEVDDPKVVAHKITKKLGEKEFRTYKIIEGIVNHFGVDFTLALLKQTLEIENSGGMLTEAGERRTIGGVFLHLAKGQLPPEQRKVIFYHRLPKQQPATPQLSAENADNQPDERPPAVSAVSEPEPAEAGTAIPQEIVEKLSILRRSATRLREKLATLEAAGQQAGQTMRRRVLETTEQQIAELEERYIRN